MIRISDFSIRSRLLVGMGAIVLLIAALGAVVVFQLRVISRDAQSIAQASAHQALVGEINAMVKDNGIASSEMLLSSDEDYHRRTLAQIDGRNQKLGQLIEQIGSDSAATPKERALLEQIGKQRAVYLEGLERIRSLLGAGKQEEATYAAGEELIPRLYPLLKAVKDFQAQQDQGMGASIGEIQAAVGTTERNAIAVALAGVALAVLVGIGITLSISRPLTEAVQMARKVADGDLTLEVAAAGRTETGQLLTALSDMVRSLRTLVAEVSAGAHAVADSSAQVAQGNVDLSQRTEEQASTLEETAGSMEELTATVNQNADHAQQASQLADGASQVAQRGGKVVGEVVTTMTGIAESSRRISEIIGVIDGIAFQTNILALNAAVEAARAGDQGRGFAVVAAEVRNLAQRSAAAAKEIKDLIGASVQQVEAGSRLADSAGATMQEIVASVQRVSELISEIANASREQSQGIAQVTTAVSQMEQVVQQNAALVEQATAATASMKEQAASLLGSVSRFELGARTGSPSLAAATAGGAPVPVRFVPAQRAGEAQARPAALARLVSVARDLPTPQWKQF
jgi:methyl-accepting chemotaxis protein